MNLDLTSAGDDTSVPAKLGLQNRARRCRSGGRATARGESSATIVSPPAPWSTCDPTPRPVRMAQRPSRGRAACCLTSGDWVGMLITTAGQARSSVNQFGGVAVYPIMG